MLTGQVKFGNINELSRQNVLRKDEKKSKKDVDKSCDMRYTKKARQERARPGSLRAKTAENIENFIV